MMEMVVFAVILAVCLCVGNYIMYKIVMYQFMKKEYLKKISKISMEVATELAEEMWKD